MIWLLIPAAFLSGFLVGRKGRSRKTTPLTQRRQGTVSGIHGFLTYDGSEQSDLP